MMRTASKKTVAVVVESSFLQAFSASRPGTPRPVSQGTKGGIDAGTWRRERVAELTAHWQVTVDVLKTSAAMIGDGSSDAPPIVAQMSV
jgi:hypothetical protein